MKGSSHGQLSNGEKQDDVGWNFCLRLTGAYIGCIFAAGPVVGWQIWQPLLVDAGFCESLCSSQNATVVLKSLDDMSRLRKALVASAAGKDLSGMVFRNTTALGDQQLKRVLAIGGTKVATPGALKMELVKAEVRKSRGSKHLKTPVKVLYQLERGCDKQYELLASIYATTSGLSQMCILSLGMTYDRYGPRWSAVDGALTCAVGLCLLAFAVWSDQSNVKFVSALGYAGLFIADVGSFLNSYSLSGFIFLFPNHKSFIVSLSGSSYAGAALVAFLPNILVSQFLWPVHLAFLAMSVLALIGLCLGLLCPGQEEYLAAAEEAIGSYDLKPRPLKENICDTLDVVKQHVGVHSVFAFNFIASNVFWMYYGSVFLALVTHFLSSQRKAAELMDWYNIFYAVLGIVAGPFAGQLADRVGFPCYVSLSIVLQLMFTAFVFVPTFSGQLVAAFLCCLWSPLIGFIMSRWSVYYAPPDLLGTLMGLLMFMSGAIGASLNSLIEYEASIYLHGQSIYVVPSAVLAIVSLVAAFIFGVVVCYRSPPEVPPAPSSALKRSPGDMRSPRSDEDSFSLLPLE